MTRKTIPLPIGGGLDRESGPMLRDAALQEDLRNVHVHRGFAYLRNGEVEAAEFTVPVPATLLVDPSVNTGNTLRFTAREGGADGNAITIAYIDPGAAGQALDVVVTGTDIVVNLATDPGDSSIISTAAEVRAAIKADPAAHALVIVEIVTDGGVSDGSGFVAAYAETALAGGAMTVADDVIAGEYLKATGVGVIAVWLEARREIHVFRITRAGTSPQYVGKWLTVAASAFDPPRVFMGEVAGLMFLAHDEQSLSVRGVTVYYDPVAGALVPLTASWAHATTIDPAGAENALRFRKVAALDEIVTVTLVDPAGNNVPLSIAVTDGDIVVTLQTDGASAVLSTAADVAAALAADVDAAELVAVAISTDDGPLGDGSGVMTAMAETVIENDGIRFRGVTEHLGAYLAGWGYGTESEAHPEYVRMSLPGEPTTFHLRHYEPIGQKGDALLRCLTTGQTLLCLKTFEHWSHFGSDRRTFGKDQLSGLVGILSPRLAIAVDVDGAGSPVAFVWTHLGPRMSTGGPMIDLAIPLALFAPEPADLEALGDPELAFAAYLPDRRQVRFHFGQRYYAYDLTEKQWSYGELGYEPSCAFLLPGVAADNVLPGSVSGLEVTEDVAEP